MATLRAALAALPTTAEGQAFATAAVHAIEAVHLELAEIHTRNEQAHDLLRTHLTAADERHAALQMPLAALEAVVGQVAAGSSTATATLVQRVLALEDVAGVTVNSIQQRLTALEMAAGATGPQVLPATPAQQSQPGTEDIQMMLDTIAGLVTKMAELESAYEDAQHKMAEIDSKIEAMAADAGARSTPTSRSVALVDERAVTDIDRFDKGGDAAFQLWAEDIRDVCSRRP